jgi:orotidine-5'-phosphate decarboxylase
MQFYRVKDQDLAKEKIIVALDVPTARQAAELVDMLGPDAKWFKIGLELFIAAGPGIVRELHERGAKIFLDLKLHDIPNTVQAAAGAISRLGIEMFTVHLAGGAEMSKAAVNAAGDALVLGVTVLTSQDEESLRSTGIQTSVSEQVLLLADLANQTGVPGLVASPSELRLLRERFGSRFRIVTPGIRPALTPAGDQKRITTPREAVLAGTDYLVIGRPIIAAPDPRSAFQLILQEVNTALKER